MLTAQEASKQLAAGTLTSVTLTEQCLKAIEEKDQEIGAFLYVDAEGARKAAKESDERRAKGEARGPLDGIPVAVKDNICVQGMPATAASLMLKDYVAAYDATVVTRLRKAGMVIIGKTNLDEFAMGSSTEKSALKKTKNPLDTTRVPGGSSGGSAAAVAAGMVPLALGTDTGGSIRQPASLTGIVGLKPTYGRVSRYGAIAMASSLDQIGPMGKSVWDVAALLQVIEGTDAQDATTAQEISTTAPDLLDASIKGKSIGVPKEYFVDGMDPAVEKLVRKALNTLKEMGAELVDISLPHLQQALPVYYIVMPAEVSSNLARYDGIRYGTRLDGENLEDVYKQTRGQLFGAEVKRRIMIGSYVLSSGYYDAYYDKAQRVRALIKQDFEEALKRCDVIASPTSPCIAWKFGEKNNDPVEMYLADIYTVSANLAGIPGISVPCGLAHGMPVGLQFMARSMDEYNLLHIANAYSTQTEWQAHKEE